MLVVDNNPKELITFQEWFKVIYNFDIVISSDGEKAIQMLDSEPISVLCTGIHIPRVDGIELIAHMTRSHPETPCIVMSEYGVPWFKEKPGRQDILYHIEKPVSPEALTTSIFVGLVLKDEGVLFKGITVRSFLPLVWKSGKTCRIQLESKSAEKGFVDFNNGIVVDAGIRDKKGAEALVQMSDWEGNKIKIMALPNESAAPKKPIDLLKLFDISWYGKRPDMNGTVEDTLSEINATRLEGDTLSSEKPFDELVNKANEELKSVQGYQGIAILSSEGKLLAKRTVDDFNMDTLKTVMRKIINMSHHALEEKVSGQYEGATIHTQAYTLVFHMVPTGYHIAVVLIPGGNWYFAKCRIEMVLAQELAHIV